jgi:Protein of unknown function (DUF3037)
MPAGETFQYALLRAIPSLARGEALNVGVVVHSRRLSFLGARVVVDEPRLRALDPDVDVEAVRSRLRTIERVAAGDPAAGQLAELDRSERFGWIVAPSSTLVQPSPVHTGLTSDPEATLARLFGELVELTGPQSRK